MIDNQYSNSLRMSKNGLSQLWQKSVVAGTFWGTLEIVLGSTLHNLMIPMAAGTVLSFAGVLIMSAISAGSIQRGLFWRAALVCALLKSVSPSAVILTPMIGIMLEGLCMELGVLLLGGNLVGMLIGGGLAVFSVPAFRIIRLFLMYGSNIYELYLQIFSPKGAQITYDEVIYWPIVLVSVLYLSLGAVAVLLGRSIGRTLNLNNINYNLLEANVKNEEVSNTRLFSYLPILYFVAHLTFLVVFLSIQAKLTTAQSVAIAAIYLIISFIFYPRTRFLFKKVWLILSIVLFSFVVPLISVASLSNLVWVEAGLKIFMRAMLVVVSFAAIGTELGKPCVRKIFSGAFFRPAYIAVSLAFNSLPDSLDRLKDFKLKGSNPLQQLHNMLVHTIHSANGNSVVFPVIIVCGERGEGKTHFIKEIVQELQKQSINYSGFYAQGIGSGNLRDGYDMVLLPNNVVQELCRRVAQCGNPMDSFKFNSKSIELGEATLAAAPQGEVVIIDEIGLLELQGSVWANALSSLLSNNNNPIIISVRKLYLQGVIDQWKIQNPFIVDINKTAVENVMYILKKYCKY